MSQLPAAFIEQTRSLLGEKEYTEFETTLQCESPVSIRINTWKQEAFEVLPIDTLDKVPWCDTGYYLKKRPAFTFDPLFHSGAYYVQEASSMFIEQVIRQYVTEPVAALDLCAAPGGKSTHIRSLLPEGSLLVSNEIIRSRSHILAENLIKWGHPGIMVTNNDPSDFGELEDLFDVILTDVPCSGEGMFRKDPGAIKEWSSENVTVCWQRQQKIIADIWNCLKPGGILLYSTCTYNLQENEKNISWMVNEYDAQPLPVAALPTWGITGSLAGNVLPVYRFLPHKTRGEGFFLAAVRKPNEKSSLQRQRSKGKFDKKRPGVQAIPDFCKTWLQNMDHFTFETNNSVMFAIPKYAKPLLSACSQVLKITHAGIVLGELKGKNLIPYHSLAMSLQLNRNAFPMAEISYKQAIAYLRKEAIVFGNEIPLGYILLTYKGYVLGFAKNIGNRANNLYPQEWRIRSGYTPDEVKVI